MVVGDYKVKQVILDILPGYMFDGYGILSTGIAIPPTQHINKKTGEIYYYVRPIFEYGSTIGMFIRHNGIIDYVNSKQSVT
jgi:hypothetical protein